MHWVDEWEQRPCVQQYVRFRGGGRGAGWLGMCVAGRCGFGTLCGFSSLSKRSARRLNTWAIESFGDAEAVRRAWAGLGVSIERGSGLLNMERMASEAIWASWITFAIPIFPSNSGP